MKLLHEMTDTELDVLSDAVYYKWRWAYLQSEAARKAGDRDREIDMGVIAQRSSRMLDAFAREIFNRQIMESDYQLVTSR